MRLERYEKLICWYFISIARLKNTELRVHREEMACGERKRAIWCQTSGGSWGCGMVWKEEVGEEGKGVHMRCGFM